MNHKVPDLDFGSPGIIMSWCQTEKLRVRASVLFFFLLFLKSGKPVAPITELCCGNSFTTRSTSNKLPRISELEWECS